MAKLLNPNKAKIHRSYTVEEIASLFSIHKITVREWVRKGLPVCDAQRPLLVLGIELRSYLQQKRTQYKQKCKSYEMYCMRCRTPQRPAENIVDYNPFNRSTGCLTGICSSCESIMYKFTASASLEQLRTELDITLPRTQKHIGDTNKPLLNSDFNS